LSRKGASVFLAFCWLCGLATGIVLFDNIFFAVAEQMILFL